MSSPKLLILLMGVGIVVIGAGTFATMLFVPVSQDTKAVTVTLSTGSGVNTISQQLKDAGVLRSTFAFETYLWLLRAEKKLQAGTYAIPRNLTMIELTRLLTTGETLSNETTITIIEGRRRDQIARDVAAALAPADADAQEDLQAEFLAATASPAPYVGEFPFLTGIPEGGTLEGYLFPDTYRVFKDTTIAAVVVRLLKNFDRRVTQELRDQLTEQWGALHEGVTVASLLESEVQETDDRRKVADLIRRRIEAGIALQLDATITFLTGKTSAQITQEDLETNSPYNTYAVRGLPPGPISGPGLDALGAAADPLPNPYFYYLTAADGTTIFSETFDEHVENRRHL